MAVAIKDGTLLTVVHVTVLSVHVLPVEEHDELQVGSEVPLVPEVVTICNELSLP